MKDPFDRPLLPFLSEGGLQQASYGMVSQEDKSHADTALADDSEDATSNHSKIDLIRVFVISYLTNSSKSFRLNLVTKSTVQLLGSNLTK